MEELTFEEFQATERRARAKQQGTYPSNASKTSSSSKKQAPKPPSAEAEAALRRELAGASEATKGAPAASSVSVSLRERLGLFLELSEMQAAVCFLLVLDSFSALFAFSGLAEIYSGHVVIELWTRGLNSFSTFALVFFLLEVVSSFVAFGTDMVTHFGYLADIVIVAVQAYCEFNNLGRAYKLLNFFRFWRALRLFFSMVDAERAAHAAAREQMMDARREAEELRQQIKLLEDDIEKEKVCIV
jgi:signal transduction histidine kinase